MNGIDIKEGDVVVQMRKPHRGAEQFDYPASKYPTLTVKSTYPGGLIFEEQTHTYGADAARFQRVTKPHEYYVIVPNPAKAHATLEAAEAYAKEYLADHDDCTVVISRTELLLEHTTDVKVTQLGQT